MIIAIDGPAGSGKSTIAKQVASMLGFHYLDTGAMYRSIAWYAIKNNIPFDKSSVLAEVARTIPVEFKHEANKPVASTVTFDGEDITKAIRSAEVDKAVSPVSALSEVRAALVEQQRRIGQTENIVVEGRDIGTVVFPNADLKIFLTASPEERAKRRAAQNKERGVGSIDQSEILQEIIRRDNADSSREASPLKMATDAHEIDTTTMTIDEVCNAIVALAQEVSKE